jgi:hypothetical protein
LIWGRSSRMTEEQRPICSGVVARAMRQAPGFVADMIFHRSRRAEIKRRKKLVARAELSERPFL